MDPAPGVEDGDETEGIPELSSLNDGPELPSVEPDGVIKDSIGPLSVRGLEADGTASPPRAAMGAVSARRIAI